MTNRIKTAFDSIYTEEKLKSTTISYINKKIKKGSKVYNPAFFNRYTVSIASLIIIIFSGIFSYNAYFTASAYVDLDINPAIELTVNHLDRIINVYAYNNDGRDILIGLDLKHKKYDDALNELIDAAAQKGFLKNEGLVSVTLQTNNTKKERELLSNIKAAMTAYHNKTQIDVFSINNNMRIHALEQNISPAKYLAIRELMDINPTTTFEHCRDRSISEIKQLTKEHLENSCHSDNEHHCKNNHHSVN